MSLVEEEGCEQKSETEPFFVDVHSFDNSVDIFGIGDRLRLVIDLNLSFEMAYKSHTIHERVAEHQFGQCR